MSQKNKRIAAIAKHTKEIGKNKNSNALDKIFKSDEKTNLLQIKIGSSLTDEIVRRSYFFQDIGGRYREQLMIDAVSCTVSLVVLDLMVQKKLRNTIEVVPAFFIYDPQLKEVTSLNENGHPEVNIYQPPVWRKDEHFFQKSIGHLNSVPEIYKLFFNHLVDNDEDSYQALVKWLAYSLKGRNPTYLVLVGGKGAGKSIFANKILKELHGAENFITMSNDTFKRQFNSEVDQNTIGYLDELHLKKEARQQISKLKLLNNDDVRVEKKGIDPYVAKNHLNIYISSNDYAGIPLESDNRRLTIPNCTHINLKDSPLADRYSEIVDVENVFKLGRYLLSLDVIFDDVRDPFVSKLVEDKIWDANSKEWERWAQSWILITLPILRKNGEVRLERFQRDFIEENPESNMTPPGKDRVERFLNENKNLGWYLKKHPTDAVTGQKGYRSFETRAGYEFRV